MARNVRNIGWATGLIAAGVVAGGVLASSMTASADTAQAPSATAPSGQRAGETLLTGTNADKARAAALTALPGATIDRVETDADGAVYEAHVTKADGTRTTVKLGADFTVTAIETGMGGGGAAPAA